MYLVGHDEEEVWAVSRGSDHRHQCHQQPPGHVEEKKRYENITQTSWLPGFNYQTIQHALALPL
jgi:hypothetical protein